MHNYNKVKFLIIQTEIINLPFSQVLYLSCMGIPTRFSLVFCKEDNFCDFQYVSMNNEIFYRVLAVLSARGLRVTQMEKGKGQNEIDNFPLEKVFIHLHITNVQGD